MTAKCAGCSDEAAEPIENEGTDPGTQVEEGHRSVHSSSAGGTDSASCLQCLFRPWQWHVKVGHPFWKAVWW